MKITIIAGTGQDMHGNAIPDLYRERALSRIRERLASMFGGYTETAHMGGWINGAGKLISEPGKSWTIFADADHGLPGIAAEYVRHELLQESVGLAIEPAAVRWIADGDSQEQAA